MLAVLAAEAGQPVSIEKLIFRLWDDAPPDHARDGIHSYISRLRRRLRPAGPAGPRIDGRAHTYVLNCPAESVDWLRFQHLVATRPIHDDSAATLALRQADNLWRAEPLAGLGGAWVEATRQAMLEQRLRATVLRITATLRLGDFTGPLSDLAGLALEHPIDETVHSLLMLAYHGSNRSTEALHVHQRLRQTLAVEYGTRPGAEITRLHRGILTQIPAADLLRVPTAAGTAAAPAAAPVTPRNLPHQPPLVGRTGELHLLADDTATADTVAVIALETVTGMAGVGKTALAVHTANRLAHHYPDAQLYLNLRAHTPGQTPLTPAEALPRLLRLLGAAADQIPPGLDEQTSLWRHMLAERKVVIVLDDATDAGQITPLLPDRTASLILITSRRRLAGLPHARTVPLDVLPIPDAIALFRSFAGHQRTTDIDAVRRIVGLCDHLPLAIEVVATRFQARPSWTLTTLAERLSRHSGRLAELRTAGKSVRNAFDLSYQALTPQQRHAFSLLGLHPGSDFTADAAAAMLGLTHTDTEHILEELHSFHLITEPVADRFRYHDLLREYARSLAPADRERIPALHRLMAYYSRTAAAADQCAYPRRLRPAPPDQQPDQQLPHTSFAGSAQAKAWLKAERDNLLAAIDNTTVSEAPLAAHLGYALAGFLEADCHWQEAEQILQHTAAHWRTNRPPDPDALAFALLALAALQTNTGAYPESAAGLQQALSHARAAHRPRIEAEALRVEGMRRWHLGEHQAALTAFRRSLLLQEENGDQWNQARVTNNIAVVSLFLQRHDDAMQYFRTALEKFAVTGDELSSARILNNIGDMYFRKGDLQAARQSFEESLTYLTEAGNRFDQATARSSLADTLTEMREPEAALSLYEQSLQEFQSLGDHKGCAQTLIGFAEAHHKLGDTDEAVRRQTAALAFATGIGALPLIAEARLRLGRYHHARGSLEQAAQHWEAATDAAAHAHDLDRVAAAQSALLHLRVTTAGRSALLPAVRASIPPLDPDEMGIVREILRNYARNLQAVSDG